MKYYLDKEGLHSRTMFVWKEFVSCQKCGKRKWCTSFDSSDLEYSVISLCFKCLDKINQVLPSNKAKLDEYGDRKKDDI